MNSCWVPGRQVLYASRDLRDDVEAANLIERCLLYFLRWRKRNLTRWVGVMLAAQMLVSRLLVGVSYLVGLVPSEADCIIEKIGDFSLGCQGQALRLIWEGGALMVPCDAIVFEEFAATLPAARASGPKRPRTSGERRKDDELADATARLIETFPWLSLEMVEEALAQAEKEAKPKKEAARGSADPAPKVDHAAVDELVGKAMDRLMAKRMADADDDDEDEAPVHFDTRTAGGLWTAAHRGVFADSSICYARGHVFTTEGLRLRNLWRAQCCGVVQGVR